MKKSILLTHFFMMIIILIFFVSAPALATENSIVRVNGIDVSSEVKAQPVNGQQYIALRPLLKQIGVIMEYNPLTAQILMLDKDDRTMIYKIGDTAIKINEADKETRPSLLLNGSTYAPLALIRDIIGSFTAASYDPANKIIDIINPEKEIHSVYSRVLEISYLPEYKGENLIAYVRFMLSNPDTSYKETLNLVNQQVEKVWQDINTATLENKTYGKSGLGRDLVYYSLKSSSIEKAKQKILCVFAIHAFEDYAPKDGQILVDLANVVIEHYKDNAFNLGSYELHIIPCANPDGLAEGWTKDGPGRCQVSLGIDINRDFNFNFRVFSDNRNKTSKKPYTSPEAQALRDLVLNGNYDIILSFHGWENRLKGNSDLIDIVNKVYAFTDLTPNYENTRGTFDGWASIFAKSMLIELPPPKNQNIIDDFTSKTIKALNYIFEPSKVDLFY